MPELPPRIASKFIEDDLTGCWFWRAALSSDGYGRVQWNGRWQMAHRVVYELLVGPIPEGMQIDHICRERSCVNPEHMEPVTQQENIRRGEVGINSANRAKTHCPAGHPYNEENTYYRSNGKRKCRVCAREKMQFQHKPLAYFLKKESNE